MYTLDEINQFKKKAKELNLIGWQQFCSTPVGDLQQICNGIGAEFMPIWLRKLTDIINPSYIASACLHDFQFHMQIGFVKANANLLYNSNIESYNYYNWLNPVLYCALWRNKKFYTLCSSLGYIAYSQCKY